jgi:hypothetical protein
MTKFLLPEKVFVLTKGAEDEYGTDNNILGVFRTKESASAYRNEYIRESYSISEDEVSDEDLEQEVEVGFNIKTYWMNT